MKYPERIVCLAAEVPEIFAELDALDRVVGISAYTKRPEAALQLPKVSGFKHGNLNRILDQRPDLVVLTSNVQKELSGQLVGAGIPVFHLNPHRFEDVFTSILMLGGFIGKNKEAEAYVARLQEQVQQIQAETIRYRYRPTVYFEEWNDPLIAGTAWVSDLIELAGGTDVFRDKSLASRQIETRIVQPDEVVQANPDLILASWCGKPVQLDAFQIRPGWQAISAVSNGEVYEVDSVVLQAGPMLLSSLEQIAALIARRAR